MSQIQIRGGHLIDPANNIDAQQDIFISAGKISGIGKAPAGFKAEQVIDAKGLHIIPGLVDLRARLREPGMEHKATIASETAAAAAGGITTLCIPPDTYPVIDTPAVVELIHRHNEQAGFCRVIPLGALTAGLAGEQISEMQTLKLAGCAGFSNALMPMQNNQVMRRAMEYAASFDLTLFVHPEDVVLAQNGCVHEGAISTRLGLAGIPEAAETLAVAQLLILVEMTGVRLHLCQVSTQRAINMIKRAQHDGLPISVDVTTHHLHLTDMDIAYFDTNCHVRPPLRTQRDRDGLRQGLKDETIQVICSDHQPHDLDAKLAPFAESESGISALETLLPLSLRLVEDGVLTLSETIDRITRQPAMILGLNVGQLGIGSSADVCIYDPAACWTVSADTLTSRGQNSPFMGWELKGQVSHTLLAGKLVYQRQTTT